MGRVYTLSLAELLQVLQSLGVEANILDVSHEVAVIDCSTTLDLPALQRRLGGIIKILKIVDVVKKREQDSVNFALKNYFKPSVIKTNFLKSTTGKIQFGVSVYLLNNIENIFGEPKRLGMFIKRAMQDTGSSIRLVLPEFNSLALASVVVTHNQLTVKGAEICVIAATNKVYVAKTVTVQDFEDYGRRDYQRPVRDDVRGMMPPKVAQSMLNLIGVQRGATLLDPFCGIGTIVQEGALLDYKMVGTDIDKFAIQGCEKNLEWFRNRYKVPKGKYHIEVSDAKNVSTFIKHLKEIKAITEVTGIVTEGTLGPLYSHKFPSPGEISQNFANLGSLYATCFDDFNKFLQPKSKIAITIPAYKKSLTEYIMFPTLDFARVYGYNIVSVIDQKVAKTLPFLRVTPRGTVIYDRKDQIVAREIVVFEKT